MINAEERFGLVVAAVAETCAGKIRARRMAAVAAENVAPSFESLSTGTVMDEYDQLGYALKLFSEAVGKMGTERQIQVLLHQRKVFPAKTEVGRRTVDHVTYATMVWSGNLLPEVPLASRQRARIHAFPKPTNEM